MVLNDNAREALVGALSNHSPGRGNASQPFGEAAHADFLFNPPNIPPVNPPPLFKVNIFKAGSPGFETVETNFGEHPTASIVTFFGKGPTTSPGNGIADAVGWLNQSGIDSLEAERTKIDRCVKDAVDLGIWSRPTTIGKNEIPTLYNGVVGRPTPVHPLTEHEQYY